MKSIEMCAIPLSVNLCIAIVLTCLAARAVADPFLTLKIFASNKVTYGKRTHIIIAVKDIGNKPFLMNVSTTGYIIAYFNTDPNALEDIGRWRLTLDLNVELQRYALTKRHAPYKYAHYYLAEVVFWHVGKHEITVQLNGTDRRSADSLHRVRKITVLQPDTIRCLPHFHLNHCTDPWQPLVLDTAVSQHLTATVKSHCRFDYFMIYVWKMCDVSEQVIIANLGRTSVPTLTVPRYRMNADGFESNRINGSVVFVLHILALGYQLREVAAARCYIVLKTRPIKAVIAGGERRDVKAGWAHFLSGKSSRDYSQAPGAYAGLSFQWRCYSDDDPENEACANANGRGRIFKLRRNALQLGMQYNFTLTVSSRTSATRDSSVATQMISVVSAPHVYLTILCRANCDMDRFEKNEAISLQAQCLNCYTRARNTYEWLVAGNVVPVDSTGARVIIETPLEMLGIEVTMKSQYGRYEYIGRATLQLKLNAGPTGGACRITPSDGYEYKTRFVVNCVGYQTEFTPMEYQFYADDMLLYRCAAREHVELSLPQTQHLDISVCDIFDVCAELELPVTVQDLNAARVLGDNGSVVETNTELAPRFLRTRKLLIRNNFRRGDWARGMLLAYITARTMKETVDPYLLGLLDQTLHSPDQLEQFLTIAHANLIKLKPLDDDKADFFGRLLGKISTNFGFLVDYYTSWDLRKHAYYRISIKLLDFISDLSNEAKRIPLTKCNYKWLNGSNNMIMADEYEQMPDFDLKVMRRIDTWLHSNRFLDRTMKLLGVCAATKYLDETPLRIDRQCCEMLLQHYDDNQDHELALKDNIHKVKISSLLIDEIREAFVATRLSFQVFRLAWNRYWWYPDCRALTSSIMAVNVISDRSAWSHEEIISQHVDIHLKLIRKMQVKQYLPSGTSNSTQRLPRAARTSNEEYIMHGSFDDDLGMKIYMTMMTPNSLIALQILYTDMPMRIKLKAHKQPNSFEVANSSCTTTEGSVMKSIVSRNPCQYKMSQLYIAFMPDIDRATYVAHDWPYRNFSFQLEVRECNSWMYARPDPRWSTERCVPALQPVVDEFIHCQCHVFSTYSATVYFTRARVINLYREVEERIAYPLPLVYGLLFLLLILMRYMKFMRGPSARNLIVECSRRPEENDRGSVIVQIHTGGQWNAGTSSNITLGFYSLQLGERQYVLYQDPFNPQVRQNTTYTLRLSSKDVRLPTLLIVGHDQAGMYPAWYLRSISIHDIRHNDLQVFPIEKWITHETVLMSSRAYNRAPDPLPPYSWCSKFRNYFEELCVNWFFFQPVMGPWRYGTIAAIAKSRFQRTCVWVGQIGASVSLCILWVHFHMPRTEQPVFNLNFENLIKVCILNYFLSLAIAIIYDRFPLN